MPGTRKLGRPSAHRKALLRGMVTYLLDNGSIETTLTRAKEVRPMTEKMITLGKKNTLASRRQALAYITKEDVVKKLFDVIAPKFEGRNGGYTQMFKLGPRRGDAAEMAIVRLTKTKEEIEAEKKAAKKATKKAAPKKVETADEAAAETTTETVTEATADEKPAKKPAAKKPAAKKAADGEKKPAAKKAPAKKAADGEKPAAKKTAAKKPAAKKADDKAE